MPQDQKQIASDPRCPFRVASSPNDPRPSSFEGAYWLYILNETSGSRPEDREFSGKWLLFIPRADVDDVWDTIRAETLAGRLGPRAKVSTALPNPDQVVLDRTKHVVAVFTFDHRDLQDVRRVRARLRELGLTEPLAYKTNRATRERRYGPLEDRTVHLLYE